jgi:hypothetical protein
MSALGEARRSQQEWDSWIASAKAADILTVAQALGANLKPAGANEWEGPCPACGGHDRFGVNTRKRLFNCRGGEGGNVIAMVAHCTGCSFLEAVERITGELRPDRSRDETEEERTIRERSHSRRAEELKRQEAEAREKEAARILREEQAVADVLGRAVPIWGTHGEEYLIRTRGLNVPRPLLVDITFVPDLDYWGSNDNGSGRLHLLETLPAIVAIIRDFSGAPIGIAQTYLDRNEPRKWRPTGSPRNSPKKVRGFKRHGLIRLGAVGESLAISEGWENALAFYLLGLGPEDLSFAAAVDLGNIGGRALETVLHPTEMGDDGRRRRMPNGDKPNPDQPGMVLPDGVKSLILLGDCDSEKFLTTAKMMLGARRFHDEGLAVAVAWAPKGLDFNEALTKRIEPEGAQAAPEEGGVACPSYNQMVASFEHPPFGVIESFEQFYERTRFLFAPPSACPPPDDTSGHYPDDPSPSPPPEDAPPPQGEDDYGFSSQPEEDKEPLPRIICPMIFFGRQPPPRLWIVQDWVPYGAVTGLYGDGGVGKSLCWRSSFRQEPRSAQHGSGSPSKRSRASASIARMTRTNCGGGSATSTRSMASITAPSARSTGCRAPARTTS